MLKRITGFLFIITMLAAAAVHAETTPTEDVRSSVEAVIVTRGGQGSTIYTDDKSIDIPLAPARQLVDPTGCGDAYRGGLLYGLQNGLDWEVTGRVASLLGAIKIEHAGTQNHAISRSDFDARFHETFGFAL